MTHDEGLRTAESGALLCPHLAQASATQQVACRLPTSCLWGLAAAAAPRRGLGSATAAVGLQQALRGSGGRAPQLQAEPLIRKTETRWPAASDHRVAGAPNHGPQGLRACTEMGRPWRTPSPLAKETDRRPSTGVRAVSTADSPLLSQTSHLLCVRISNVSFVPYHVSLFDSRMMVLTVP